MERDDKYSVWVYYIGVGTLFISCHVNRHPSAPSCPNIYRRHRRRRRRRRRYSVPAFAY